MASALENVDCPVKDIAEHRRISVLETEYRSRQERDKARNEQLAVELEMDAQKIEVRGIC